MTAPFGVWNPSPASLELAEGEIHLWWIDLDGSDLDGCLSICSEDERQRANRLIIPEVRRRWTASRAALRRVLAGYLELSPSSVSFGTGSQGKPFVTNPWKSRIEFNLAHTRGRTLLAVTLERSIGVDLEQQRPVPQAVSLAARWYAGNEVKWLEGLPHENVASAFLWAWVKKEAYLKARGGGISAGLQSLDTTRLDFDGITVDPEGVCWWVGSFEPEPGFISAIAIEKGWDRVHGYTPTFEN